MGSASRLSTRAALAWVSLTRVHWAVTLVLSLAILFLVAAWPVRAVMGSPNPGIRAIEGLASSAPLFVLLFAATYYVMSQSDVADFSASSSASASGVFAGAVRLGRARNHGVRSPRDDA
ncbi:hypothetical protein ABZX12_03870 [Kribbella sp. NPDC003505]|uniref:hypothetical protein n=1 Tax=Kribbella sp. NPDC003505 TaxID=3154448 RepID=UPI0033AE1E55